MSCDWLRRVSKRSFQCNKLNSKIFWSIFGHVSIGNGHLSTLLATSQLNFRYEKYDSLRMKLTIHWKNSMFRKWSVKFIRQKKIFLTKEENSLTFWWLEIKSQIISSWKILLYIRLIMKSANNIFRPTTFVEIFLALETD